MVALAPSFNLVVEKLQDLGGDNVGPVAPEECDDTTVRQMTEVLCSLAQRVVDDMARRDVLDARQEC